MIKKTVTYTDFNGVERTEDFYFNLNKAELMEMELATIGGFSDAVKKLINAKDMPAVVSIFKDFVLKSYGEKSADGKRFIKSDELRTAFEQTEAYSQIFMELATNADAAAEFVNGIIPADLAKEVAKQNLTLAPVNN